MLSVEEMRELALLMHWSGIAALDVEGPGQRLSLRVSPPAGVAEAASGPPATGITANAPCMGFFSRRHPDGLFATPDVEDRVSASGIVGFVQDDGLLLPVRAPASGRLMGILAAEGSLVGHGDPLIALEV